METHPSYAAETLYFRGYWLKTTSETRLVDTGNYGNRLGTPESCGCEYTLVLVSEYSRKSSYFSSRSLLSFEF